MIALLSFTACKEAEDSSSINGMKNKYAEYFFPLSTFDEPMVYAFIDIKNPIDERFIRVHELEFENKNYAILEKFNNNLRLFEGYTLNYDEHLSVEEHMIVDKHGIKTKTRLNKNLYFPNEKNSSIKFITDFPSHLDSIQMIYHSTKTIINDDLKTEVMGEEVPAIQIRDSLLILLVNTYNKETGKTSVIIDEFYAKGHGLVQWQSEDETVQYKLNKIIDAKEWENIMKY